MSDAEGRELSCPWPDCPHGADCVHAVETGWVCSCPIHPASRRRGYDWGCPVHGRTSGRVSSGFDFLPDPSTLSPAEAGDWVGRMMWAFPMSDPRSEFVRRLGLRIAEFESAPARGSSVHTDT